jgi:hypothetical protein
MLKKDKTRFLQLASTDEEMRISAALELTDLPRGHFEDHPVSSKFIQEQLPNFVRAYRDTRNELVREWIVQGIACGQIFNQEIKRIVEAEINPSCLFLPTLLYLTWLNAPEFQDSKEKIKELHNHGDFEVRWRVALVLEKLNLEYENDSDVIRSLLLDEYPTTRIYAVLALKKLGRLETIDETTLREVIRIDDGAAQQYARQLMMTCKTIKD